MKRVVEKRRVILIKACWGFNRNLQQRYFYERRRGDGNDTKGEMLHHHTRWAFVEDIRDATNLDILKTEDAMKLFYDIKDALIKDEEIELVDLELTMEYHRVEFDADSEREYLREKALNKLSIDEIEALGINNLAIYSKLKNYNT